MEFTKLVASNFYVHELAVDSDGAKITSDDIELRIIEVIEGGSWKMYDFDDGTFKTSITTKQDDCSHNTVDGYSTGVWENNTALDYTAFTAGRKYIFEFYNNTESELVSQSEFQWAGDYGAIASEGDAMDLVADAVDITSMANGTITEPKIASAAITAAKFGAGAIDAAALNADAVAEIWAIVVDATNGDITALTALERILNARTSKLGTGDNEGSPETDVDTVYKQDGATTSFVTNYKTSGERNIGPGA